MNTAALHWWIKACKRNWLVIFFVQAQKCKKDSKKQASCLNILCFNNLRCPEDVSTVFLLDFYSLIPLIAGKLLGWTSGSFTPSLIPLLLVIALFPPYIKISLYHQCLYPLNTCGLNHHQIKLYRFSSFSLASNPSLQLFNIFDILL